MRDAETRSAERFSLIDSEDEAKFARFAMNALRSSGDRCLLEPLKDVGVWTKTSEQRQDFAIRQAAIELGESFELFGVTTWGLAHDRYRSMLKCRKCGETSGSQLHLVSHEDPRVKECIKGQKEHLESNQAMFLKSMGVDASKFLDMELDDCYRIKGYAIRCGMCHSTNVDYRAVDYWRDEPKPLITNRLGTFRHKATGIMLQLLPGQVCPAEDRCMGHNEDHKSSGEHWCDCLVIDMKPFLMGRYPVTNNQARVDHSFQVISQVHPEKNDLPIAGFDEHNYISWAKYWGFRLPKDTEWTYAFKGRSEDRYYWGESFDNRFGWSFSNPEVYQNRHRRSDSPFDPVINDKRMRWNQYGLVDMIGNVWEVCQDAEYADTENPQQVIHGGSYTTRESVISSNIQYTHHFMDIDNDRSTVGFRVSKTLPGV